MIGIRLTQNELVLEFGLFLPGQDGRTKPDPKDVNIRIVATPAMLEGMLKGLEQAKKLWDEQQARTKLNQAKTGPAQ
jgi:hypothetical protein